MKVMPFDLVAEVTFRRLRVFIEQRVDHHLFDLRTGNLSPLLGVLARAVQIRNLRVLCGCFVVGEGVALDRLVEQRSKDHITLREGLRFCSRLQ